MTSLLAVMFSRQGWHTAILDADITGPSIPKAFGLTGGVRNNPDGSVEMELQGEESAIEQVIEAIRRGRYIEIESMDVKNLPAREDRGFTAE